MSISSALSNALSGLAASSRSAGVVSNNLANVLTEGYAPRAIELTTRSDGHGGGVSIGSVTRNVDTVLLNERRLADSNMAYAEPLAGFSTNLEAEIGIPGQTGSLSDRFARLEAAFVAASATPEDNIRLADIALRAGQLGEKLNTISDHIQLERVRTDEQIEQAVGFINTKLEQIQNLNAQIANANNAGHPNASLQDERQSAIDALAEYIPVRLTERRNGTVAIYTPGGAVLVDGKPATFSFTASNLIEPHMTVENGLISSLEVNGVTVAASGDRSPVSGGRLSALFEVRDELSVAAQSEIDAIARNLIERFQQPALDPTAMPSDPGLFTDGGAFFVASNEVGLAGRISVNAAVDPEKGGDLWRIRDGLGALAAGPAGNGSLLNAFKDALTDFNAMASGGLGATQRSLDGHIASLVSKVSHDRLTVEENLSFATAQQASLVEIELQNGVDSDAELQRLLLIEQAYGANARMIQTVEDLLDTLLRI
ncbi:flagellar hook-associated protein FlgK [Roseovarius phycicola]|uniref:Flagellar hook-associated protein 1 n=1 Tax=Roseovarius phycicola TaxID=3080976 RepID=A0ABZ2HKB5_9RHOB